MIQPSTYEALPEDIKSRWKAENVEKVFTQISHEGHLEYVIVPKDPKLFVEWWSQRKNLQHINSSLDPNGWIYNGHYGTGRPPWAQ
jgi:hypothetical protein